MREKRDRGGRGRGKGKDGNVGAERRWKKTKEVEEGDGECEGKVGKRDGERGVEG